MLRITPHEAVKPMKQFRQATFAAAALVLAAHTASGDWPTLRGNAQRTGWLEGRIQPPYRVSWVRHFLGERIGPGVEPIAADGTVYVATHSGNLYALRAQDGKPLWRARSGGGAFLHAPAIHRGVLYAADAGGALQSMDAKTGKAGWAIHVGSGGFAASPTVDDYAVYIGTREGDFLAVRVADGRTAWRHRLPAPIRQTAALHGGRVFVAAEDMRLRAFEARTGKVLWVSERLPGQTCRDYYPVIAVPGDRAHVVVRTSPSLDMAQRVSQDAQLLCRIAGIASDWRAVDEWLKREERQETPERLLREQHAIVEHLRAHPEARTFFAFDAATGRPAPPAPVLWAAGCQAVGTPPVAMPDGRLFLLYRSVYGNWSLGVAPLVAVGMLDLQRNQVALLRHAHGAQPPWNTFWGTADESQNHVVVGDTALLVHQATLSSLNLRSGELHTVAGERDSWGGFRNLPWVRNEWNGPARGGVAVMGSRIFWQTGSRLLCITASEGGAPAKDETTAAAEVPLRGRTPNSPAPLPALPGRLRHAVAEALAHPWMPLWMEPGIGGRWQAFNQSGEVMEALSAAYPHLPTDDQRRVKAYLADLWRSHPPYSTAAWLPSDSGKPREWAEVPASIRATGREAPPFQPFGNLHAVWLYAQRCDEWARVQQAWPALRESFQAFIQSGWRLDPDRGDPYANRYLASLYAFERMAKRLQDPETAAAARQAIEQLETQIVAWWKSSAAKAALPVIPSIKEWDAFLHHGDALFHTVKPHRAVIALFQDITPELAELLRARAPDSVKKLMAMFRALCPTWHLVGEERQVHTGENLYDPPGFALSAFRAHLWLEEPPPRVVAERVDVPMCRADLYHILKIALALDRAKAAAVHRKPARSPRP
jgi:hypothetical protein